MSVCHGPIDMFVVYESPRDFPGKFVVRRWTVADPYFKHGTSGIPDPQPVAVVESLEAARRKVPPGRFNIGRYPQDDVAIREVWL